MVRAESEGQMPFSKFTAKLILCAGAIALCQLAMPGLAQAKTETAILAGGCFWCVESNFESVDGVIDVVSGFTGGSLADPTYEAVSATETGHYEAVQITFDADTVSYARIVNLFLRSTDVTDVGGQFCDRGNSYRSAVFAAPDQEATATAEVAAAAAELGRSVVTPVLPAATFYPADAYHQDYYKGSAIVLTRRGPKSKANAYAFYRKACGRDARIEELWGKSAAFLH